MVRAYVRPIAAIALGTIWSLNVPAATAGMRRECAQQCASRVAEECVTKRAKCKARLLRQCRREAKRAQSPDAIASFCAIGTTTTTLPPPADYAGAWVFDGYIVDQTPGLIGPLETVYDFAITQEGESIAVTHPRTGYTLNGQVTQSGFEAARTGPAKVTIEGVPAPGCVQETAITAVCNAEKTACDVTYTSSVDVTDVCELGVPLWYISTGPMTRQ